MKMGLIKVVSPAQAGRIIDRRLAGIEKRGFTGRAALARLIRPGNIAASFGAGELSGVSHHDAKAFAEWAGVRLPTEFEWEKAARGTEGLAYPFGNEFDRSRVVFNSDRTQPVNRNGVEDGASPYGGLDMAGNVWEWTDSWHGKLDLSDRRNPKGLEKGDRKVLRGGSWPDDNPAFLSGSSRDLDFPEKGGVNVGFRVAEDL